MDNVILNNLLKKYLSEKLDMTITDVTYVSELNHWSNYIRYNYWSDDYKFKEGISHIDKNDYLQLIRKAKIKNIQDNERNKI